MTMETILYDLKEGVGTITFNRPDVLNATNDTFYIELNALLAEIAKDESVGAVVLTGAGRGFCAGADVRAMDPDASPLKRHGTVGFFATFSAL